MKKWQVPVLIIASFGFYASYYSTLLLLLILSIFINAIAGYKIVHSQTKYKRIYAIAGVSLNIAILGFFKYSGLFAVSFLNNDSSVGKFLISIPLPIGISFFTFQGISLLVDTYKGKYNSLSDNKESFWNYLITITFFKSFFPQLVSGPIVKAHDFIPQINSKSISEINWEYAIRLLILGYFLKMFVADNLKDYTFWLEYPYFLNYSTFELLTLLFAYSIQIFADFAGYSLIAIGVSVLFGYHIQSNFNFPYISKSFSEFWQRWHISLSSFLKEYLYIPLGGNRRGKIRTYLNLILVMCLGGLWHGAAWSYAIWGLFHGVLLAVERLSSNVFKNDYLLLKFLNVFIVFVMVTLGWLLFKLPDFNHVISFFNALGSNINMQPKDHFWLPILFYSFPIVFYHINYIIKRGNLKTSYIIKRNEHFIFALMLTAIILGSGTAKAFIYFQF